MPAGAPRIAVFDVGNVLLDWDMRHLYRKLFADEARMEWFLAEVCTPAWNLGFDGGRLFADGVAELTAKHPDLAAEIRAFDARWLETVRAPIEGSVALLQRLRAAGQPTYAITNFSAEKFEDACRTWPFLTGFDGVVVSGRERLLKPDPAIFHLLLDRYGLAAEDCLFIDDVPANVAAAEGVGMHGHRFESPEGLAKVLAGHGFPV
jgi:2-haloacid dehalogenase